MSNYDSLEAVVENEPSEFTTHISEINRRLASEDPHDRMDAGRAFRVVAEEHPTVLEPHVETLIELLSADNGSLQLLGAFGVAGLAEPAPETASKAVPELVALLDDTDAPAIQMAVLRALSRIDDMSPTAVSTVDHPIFKQRENPAVHGGEDVTTLALIAETDPTALSSISGVHDQVTELRDRRTVHLRHYTDYIERASDILQRINIDSPEPK